MDELAGTGVLFRRWTVPSARAAFILVHGLGAHSARWHFLASHLARNGYASYGIELRGYGRTPERPRGHVDSYRVWDRDILALSETVARENPGRRIFLLGESLGGLVAYNLAAKHPDRFAGQILISPAFKNGLKFPLSLYAAMPFLMVVNPRKTVPIPFTSAMCTRDAAYQEVMDTCPDEVRVASLKLLVNALGEQMGASRRAKKHGVPALFLLAGQDELVDPRAARKAFAKHGAGDKTLLEYPEMRHALSIELDRERVFEDILAWVEKRV
ncbi:MAG TPA: alpha/beta fold hydrolase [Acidobacteriota bacterium]|nr:alpha/beta fold hydrolase [Acidobacteriota bacterium]